MIMTMIFLLSILFLFLSHPMSMSLILLSEAILISLLLGFLNSTFWFSYILFLVMVGGVLILFIYMTSIASNELFSYTNLTTILLTILLLSSILNNLDYYYLNLNFSFMENYTFTNYSLNKFFNYPSMMLTSFLMIYLFITLLATVKITKIEFGPLRQLN